MRNKVSHVMSGLAAARVDVTASNRRAPARVTRRPRRSASHPSRGAPIAPPAKTEPSSSES